jgi:membrane associated rhomboid family serine protease
MIPARAIQDAVAVLVLAVPVLLLLSLFIYAFVSGWRRRRQDRRKIMADGTTAQAVVTKIVDSPRNDQSVVYFSFQPTTADRNFDGMQRTTKAAIERSGITVGSSVEVHYLAKWPRWAFVNALTLAERGLPPRTRAADSVAEPASTAGLFYVSYSDPARRGSQTSVANSYRWYGNGDVVFLDRTIRFTAWRHWRRRPIQREFPVDTIENVEQLQSTVRLEIVEHGERRKVQLWAVNPNEAAAIARLLPGKKTAAFAPLLAERAAFAATLLTITPRAPVTPALIGANVLMFVVATALGGGLLISDPAVMIRLGTDYTPLTWSGQWWRLLTSTFLHFGLLHIALNMWALYVNGLVAERIFGSVRYLAIYLVAGVSGSVASLLWHPVVNGAGASGAIFGVLGALLAFFLLRNGGLSASVVTAQRTSAGVFIVYSLLNGTRYGIDNAAHVGGLVGGFVMGLILARPLNVERNSKRWTGQWATAIGLVACAATLFAYLNRTGSLAPRLAYDANGKPMPLAGLSVPLQSLGGFRLGMTAKELLAEKGRPIHQSEWEWDYNSIDARHDGVLSVEFAHQGEHTLGPVSIIEFFGNQESAPAEIPYLGGLTVAELVGKYGEPASRVPMTGGTAFLWFGNGIMVGTRNDKVYRYGIFDYRLAGNR